MRIVISSSANALSEYLDAFDGPTGTVEAEYGDVVVRGSEFTLAHHGPRSHQPAPCLTEAGSLPVVELIGLSHFDLDSLMGCGIAMGRSYPKTFAILAAFVDVNGPHRGQDHEAWVTCPRETGTFTWGQALQAFWAWSAKHRLYPPKGKFVQDCTRFVEEALDVLDNILGGDENLLQTGQEFEANETLLNGATFVETAYHALGGIILRQGVSFCNHLYAEPNGTLCRAVVAHNVKTGAVTLSFSNPEELTAAEFEGAPARYFVQKLWGPEAGGHAGIAGSPRDSALTLNDARKLVKLVGRHL